MTVPYCPEEPSLSQGKTVIAIGNFDGVHIGHRQLFVEAKKLKEKLENQTNGPVKVLVLTFWPHPKSFFKDPSFRLIYSKEQRADLISALDEVDQLVTLPFDKDLMDLSYEDFFREILLEKFKAAAIVVGDNFRFGKGGLGDSIKLMALGQKAGVDVLIVPRVNYLDQPVSSSRIREALVLGRMEEVNAMLGQPYQVKGMVSHGKGVGHLLETPTVNILLSPEMESPRQGVYLSRTHAGGAVYNSISNVGTNPTFGTESPRTETFIFDYTGDLYGSEITIEYLRFMRPEIRFEDPEALKAQLRQDISLAKAMLEKEENLS